MAVNFENYKVFYYVGKYKNITKAANALCISQPTVTKEIQAFQEELGCKLITRASKGVVLTPEGEQLYEKIAPAVEMLYSAEESIRHLVQVNAGTLVIGVNRYMTERILRPYIEQYQKTYPGMNILFTYGKRNILDASLTKHLTDIAFTYRPYRKNARSFSKNEFERLRHESYVWRPEMDIYRLLTGKYVVVVGKKMKGLAKQSVIKAAELYEYPLVLQVQQIEDCEMEMLNILRPEGKITENDLVMENVSGCVQAIKTGKYIGVMNEATITKELYEGTLIPLPLEEELPTYELLMFHQKNMPLCLAAQKLKTQILSDPTLKIEHVEIDEQFQI